MYLPYAKDTSFPWWRWLQKIFKLLDLLDDRWWHWSPEESIQYPNQAPDHWVFTGLFYRLGVVTFTGLLVLRGRPKDAIPEIIEALRTKRAIVSLNLDGSIGPLKNRDWLEPIGEFLQTNYRNVGAGFWISPSLAAECIPPHEVPADAAITW